jgi:hypothetical protein
MDWLEGKELSPIKSDIFSAQVLRKVAQLMVGRQIQQGYSSAWAVQSPPPSEAMIVSSSGVQFRTCVARSYSV